MVIVDYFIVGHCWLFYCSLLMANNDYLLMVISGYSTDGVFLLF